ncbi:uncharacterized protein BcabD6B2_50720 [Babesia caballi]|uniref:Transmembrane protein, putative n=1 Tax=Babesia caballi TaxID=5871 RepID=A0AAV4M167_BABCB|nr:transmembrane protein, putative [Babesia caballi]
MPQTLGTWHMKLDAEEDLITGANFNIEVSFYNPAIYSVTFYPKKAVFYNYPIGSDVECLKCNYTGRSSEQDGVKGDKYKLHREVLRLTTDGLISLRDFEVVVPRKTTQFGIFKASVPFRAYFKIPRNNTALLAELKPLYLDCKKHKTLLLSIRIEDVHTRFGFITRKVPSEYELFLPLRCEVDAGIDNWFQDPGSFNGVILGGAANIAANHNDAWA